MSRTCPPWTLWRSPSGAVTAALATIGGHEFACVRMPPAVAQEVLARAGMLEWAAQPAPRPDPIEAMHPDAMTALAADVARDLLLASWVEREPGTGRRVPLADAFDEVLGENHLRTARWLAFCLDVFADALRGAPAQPPSEVPPCRER